MNDDLIPPAEVLEHAQFVRRLAGALLQGDADADDAAQETLARALERPPRRGPGLAGWFATVLRNVVRKGRRSSARRESRERATASPEATRSAATSAARAEILHAVADAVRSLDPASREVVLLRHYEGLPPRAIALRLSVPVETVKSRLKRAHERLRTLLDERRGGNVEGWRSALGVLVGFDPIRGGIAPVGGIAMGTATKVGMGVVVVALAVTGVAVLSPRDEVRLTDSTDVAASGTEAAASGSEEVPTLAGSPAPAGSGFGATSPTPTPARSPDATPAPLPPEGVTPKDVIEIALVGAMRGRYVAMLEVDAAWPKKAEPREVTTEAGEALRFDGVAPGIYRVRVEGPGGVVMRWQLVIPQQAGGNVSQSVRFGNAAIEGRVYERDGSPAAGCRVTVVPQGLMGSPSTVEVRADEAGAYRIDGLPPGTHLLNAALRTDPDRDVRTAFAQVGPAETKTVDFGAAAAEPVFSGVVRLASGAPIRGPLNIGLVGATQVGVPVDAEGKFSKRVPAGSYDLVLSFAGRRDPFRMPISIPEAGLAQDVAVSGVRVSGFLRDGATGRPFPPGTSWAGLPKVRIVDVAQEPRPVSSGWLPPEQVRALPDADGAFFFDGVLPGRYRLTAEPPAGDKREGSSAEVVVGPNRDEIGVLLEIRAK